MRTRTKPGARWGCSMSDGPTGWELVQPFAPTPLSQTQSIEFRAYCSFRIRLDFGPIAVIAAMSVSVQIEVRRSEDAADQPTVSLSIAVVGSISVKVGGYTLRVGWSTFLSGPIVWEPPRLAAAPLMLPKP
ncbi:hypothetical protein [Bosea massiliensis]|jgi:hypothetical protein|uniref:Uncharacterized protein n=1 Tax=Bosea massiliensis TaxID=151419 RepID=A0ABW0NY57_9HYPH